MFQSIFGKSVHPTMTREEIITVGLWLHDEPVWTLIKSIIHMKFINRKQQLAIECEKTRRAAAKASLTTVNEEQ